MSLDNTGRYEAARFALRNYQMGEGWGYQNGLVAFSQPTVYMLKSGALSIHVGVREHVTTPQRRLANV